MLRIAPFAFAFVLFSMLLLSVRVAFAQDASTETVQVNIDGITRTLTITFVATGVVAVDVAPVTDTTLYPKRYTPFVRQYRFAIHNCRRWLQFHEGFTTNEDNSGIFLVGTYVSLQNFCANRYQEAYVEMERIIHNTDWAPHPTFAD